MKKIFYLVILLFSVTATGFGQANTTLSNLVSPTAVNQDLFPKTDTGQSLGSYTKAWKRIYLASGLYLSDSLFLHGKGLRNAFVGLRSGFAITSGYDNTADGFHSLFTLTTGNRNTAIGSYALSKNTAFDNTAVGAYSLQNNTEGSNNAAVGSFALNANTSGSYALANGYAALYKNTTGNGNAAMGYKALYSNTTGYSNIAVGTYSLYSNVAGKYSIGIGDSALYKSTGSSNVAIGSKALYNNITGSRNTALGYNANVSSSAYSNATAIGSNAYAGCSNCMVLGGVNGTNGASSNTNVGIGTTKPVAPLHINSTGSLSLTIPGHMVVGDLGSYNLGIDYYQIQARSDSTYSNFYINNWGGTTYAGNYTNSYYGLVGYGSNYGVYGLSNANGVYGSGDYGVYGTGTTYGVYGYSSTFNKSAVHGEGTYAFGVSGNSSNNYGGYFTSTTFHGLIARTSSTASNIYAAIFQGSTFCYGTYQTSDERVKKNIADVKDGMALINLLKPKTYHFKSDGKFANLNLPKGNQYGLLAQDVEKILPGLVQEAPLEVQPIDSSGLQEKAALYAKDSAIVLKKKTIETMQVKGINYTELIPVMIKGMQELDQKTQRIDELENEVNELKQLVQQLIQNKNTNGITSFLKQNVPNPSKGSTLIAFQIAAGSRTAAIQIIQTGSGKVLQTIPVNVYARQATINISSFATGSYMYALIVDGKQADSKQMIITK